MEHPLVRSIRNQSHRMPQLDHLDSIPIHDGSLRNATGNPIAFTYESNYTPVSYECYHMTPSSLTQQEFYRNYSQCDDQIPKDTQALITWLDQRIAGLMAYYHEVCGVLTKVMYQHILTLEAFNIWLSMKGRWYMYRPQVYDSYKMSMPEYVLVIRKSDTESSRARKRNEARASKKQKKAKEEEEEDKQEEEEEEEEQDEEENSPLSLSNIIRRVLGVVNEKEVTNLLRDRMRDTLTRSRFTHITLKDVPTDMVKYDVHGLPKTMRIINMLNTKDSADAYWCHPLFRPCEYIWKESASKEYNLGVVAWYASFPMLVELRRHCLKGGGGGEDEKKNNNRAKRKRSVTTTTTTTTTTEIDEFRLREFFDNSRILHPSKLRYTYYARHGMVYATRVLPVVNGYTLWDTFSITNSYWNYIVDLLDNRHITQSKWNAYYNDEGVLISTGPNLAIGENTNNGNPIVVQQITYYVKNNKQDTYEEVYLLKFLLEHGKPLELQERIDALFMICDSFTEVLINLRLSMGGNGLSLKTVKESAFRSYKERMDYIENFRINEENGKTKKKNRYKPLVNWIISPNEHDLYLASISFLDKHHVRCVVQDSTTSTEEIIRSEVDSLCRTLTFIPARLEQYSHMAVEFEVKDTNKITRCDSLSRYLTYCRIQIKKNILIPIAKAWYLFNPVVELPDEYKKGDSTFAHLRQIVISEVCSNQFRSNINHLITSKHHHQLSPSDVSLLNCAYQVMKHELPETDSILTQLNQISKQQHSEQKQDDFRTRCKNRIECMMQQRSELDPDILLDIIDKMAYKQGRVFGSIYEIEAMIKEIVNIQEYTHNYGKQVRKFSQTAIHHPNRFISGLADSLNRV